MNKPSYLTAVRFDNEILQPATRGDIERLRVAIEGNAECLRLAIEGNAKHLRLAIRNDLLTDLMKGAIVTTLVLSWLVILIKLF